MTKAQALRIRKRYYDNRLKEAKEYHQRMSCHLSTCRSNELWFVNWQLEKVNKRIEKAQKSSRWLLSLINDEKKIERGEEVKVRESYDVELIKKIPIDTIVKVMPNGFFENNPFRNERSPSNSLHWNKRTNVWTDYGSGNFGDVIDLYMFIHNCNFMEACKNLSYFI